MGGGRRKASPQTISKHWLYRCSTKEIHRMSRIKDPSPCWILLTRYSLRYYRPRLPELNMVLEVLVQPSSPCLLQEESKTSRRQVVASYYYATFLDWKQAFDKINHHRMFEALERTNIPPKVRRIIKALYRKPFLSSSAWWVHFASILSALSPYLFIIVMSVLFADI